MNLAIDARMIDSSGIGRYLQQLLPEIALLGVTDCVLIGNPEKLSPFIAPGWDVVPYFESIYSPRQHLNYPLRSRSFDVAYFPHIHLPFFATPGKKTVVTIHDVFHLSACSTLSVLEKAYMKLYYRHAVRTADLLLTDSYFTLHSLEALFPGKQIGTHEVIYPCLYDFSLGDESESTIVSDLGTRSEGKRRLLYVGNVKPHKNLLRLVEAVNDHQLEDCVLYIVGKKEGFLRGLSERDRVSLESDKVIFTGWIDDTNLRRLYILCDLLVFPSLYEGFGYPPLESLSMGTPAVVSDIPVIHEVCDESVMYFDPYSVSSMVSVIRRALDDPDFRATSIRIAQSILGRYCRENTSKKQALAITTLL
jgi:glycosyltransferase involved in cell wall biosynthesis